MGIRGKQQLLTEVREVVVLIARGERLFLERRIWEHASLSCYLNGIINVIFHWFPKCSHPEAIKAFGGYAPMDILGKAQYQIERKGKDAHIVRMLSS